MNEIVSAARSYLNVPWRHQARSRLGVDCVGLVICIARDLGIVPPTFDIGGYGREPDGASLIRHLDTRLSRVPRQQLAPGHVVCVAFAKNPQHIGIVGDYVHGGLSIIHAASTYGRVLETRLLFSESMRFVSAYELPRVG